MGTDFAHTEKYAGSHNELETKRAWLVSGLNLLSLPMWKKSILQLGKNKWFHTAIEVIYYHYTFCWNTSLETPLWIRWVHSYEDCVGHSKIWCEVPLHTMNRNCIIVIIIFMFHLWHQQTFLMKSGCFPPITGQASAYSGAILLGLCCPTGDSFFFFSMLFRVNLNRV